VDIILGIIGILVVLALGYLMSNEKNNINFKAVAIMIVLQLIITWFMFATSLGQAVINGISAVFNQLIAFGMSGISFVVGGFTFEEGSGGVFFFNVLLLIIFFSALLSVLTYLRVLPVIIKYFGGLISKITGLPRIESFNAVNSIFFGQSEALIAIRSQFQQLDKNRLFIVCSSAMSSVSASIVGSYMLMLPEQYVLAALPLNMLSALVVSSVVAPVKVPEAEDYVDITNVTSDKSVFEALGNGALEGGKIALIVAANLIAFIAMLGLVNWLIQLVFAGVTIQQILGYIFAPFVWLMGVPANEVLQVGSVMGTKIVTNEFVAMEQFQPLVNSLSDKAVGVGTVFLTSFANFSSIGIIAGTVQGIDMKKASTVSAFGMKLLIVSILTSILSATIAGLFL